ncbi:MAG: YCF48-related protein [Acidobacteriota bacterium]|nr:YCF48-related protein [Acidobacteriota bacterium]
MHDDAPDRLFAAGRSGCYVSTDGAATFNLMSSGLPTGSRASDVVIHPQDADTVYCAILGGASPGVYKSVDGGSTWVAKNNRLPASTGRIALAISRSSPDVLIAGVDVSGGTVYKTSDGGDSWTSANTGIDPSDPKTWVGIMVVDPSDRNNMWAGTDNVYRTTDARATNWDSVSNTLAGGSLIGALDVAPSDSTRIYAGFSNGSLYNTENALRMNPRWRSIRDSSMPNRGVRRIRTSEADAETVYVVFNGFGSGKIWKTTDGGSNWTDRTGDLCDAASRTY